MRYPVDRNGLAVPIQELGYEVVPHIRRETNRHHLSFERQRYMGSSLLRIYRGLESRVVDMRIADHNDLHEHFSSPKVPRIVSMIDCIEEYLDVNGSINVVREKKTHETYEISPDSWELIKGGNCGQIITAGSCRPNQFADAELASSLSR